MIVQNLIQAFNDPFQSYCQYSMIKTAIAVINEPSTVQDYDIRQAFSRRVLTGNVNLRLVIFGLLGDSTLADATVLDVSDTAIQAAVDNQMSAIYTAYAKADVK